MTRHFSHRLLVGIAVALLVVPVAARDLGGPMTEPDEDDFPWAEHRGPRPLERLGDQERAREALRQGETVPLRKIMERVAADFVGDMLEVQLERHRGRMIYEIRLLTPDGTVFDLYYDAGSMDLLRARGRGLAKWYKGDPEALLRAIPPMKRHHVEENMRAMAPLPSFGHRFFLWWHRQWDDGEPPEGRR